MARRQLQAGIGHQIDEGRPHRRRGIVHGADHGFILLRPGHGEHSGEAGADGVGLVAHAAGDDHLAVFGNGLADRFQAFGLGGIQKPAGVDDHHVGAGIIARQRIAIGAQLGEDAFGID